MKLLAAAYIAVLGGVVALTDAMPPGVERHLEITPDGVVATFTIPDGCYVYVERWAFPEDPQRPNIPGVLICEDDAR